MGEPVCWDEPSDDYMCIEERFPRNTRMKLRPNRPKERNSPNRSKRRSVNVADPYTCRYVLEEWDRGGTLEANLHHQKVRRLPNRSVNQTPEGIAAPAYWFGQ